MKFRKNKAAHPIAAAVSAIQSEIANQGTDLTDANIATGLVSMESLDHVGIEQVSNSLSAAERMIQDTLQDDLGLESLSPAQLEAGALIALAGGDPVGYASKAYTNFAGSMEGINVIDADTAGIDFRSKASLESFDEQELRKHLAFSVVYNVQAARQDAFAEAFYPTAVVSPEQAGLDLTIRNITVFNEVRRNLSGDAADFKRQNLLDAHSDHRILENIATKIVPHVDPRDTNANKFVDAALVAPRNILVDGVSVPTAPLKLGVEIDALAISQVPALLSNGVMDNTDSLDARIGLDTLYMTVTDGTDTEVLSFGTGSLPRAGFVKAIEGSGREMVLNFSTNDLMLTGEITTADKAVSALLDAVKTAGVAVFLSVDVNGKANVETGNVKVYSSAVTVDRVVDADGNLLDLAAGPGKTIADLFVGTAMFGYDIDANRTNSNRRTRGLLIDTQEYTERYSIPLGAPVSTPAPANSNREAADLASLITATRIGITNDAVTSLLAYTETLKQFVLGGDVTKDVEIEGIARMLIKPFYEESELDLTTEVNSISTHERQADISALIIGRIRDIAYRMYRNSRYGSALEALNGGNAEKPQLVIGTDAVLQQHIMVPGDSRSAGIGFDFKVASTPDGRMDDTIILTFARTNAAADDVLSFGTHAWIPEMTSTTNVTRNGAVSKEVMVQKRSRHVNKLPIMAKITVKGLEEALSKKA